MIQRIQSLYFLLAAVCPALTFALPFAKTQLGGAAAWFYSCHTEGLPQDFRYVAWDTSAAAVLAVVLALLALFSYKTRKRQVRLAKASLVADVLWLYCAAVHVAQYVSETKADFLPHVGAFLPVISIVFCVLAWRAVKHDDELVRAADRIR